MSNYITWKTGHQYMRTNRIRDNCVIHSITTNQNVFTHAYLTAKLFNTD